MRLNDVQFENGLPIESYGPGFFRIAGAVQEGAILLSPAGLMPWDGSVAALLDLAKAVDVIFYGTGAEVSHPPKDLRQSVEAAGIGLEAMATPAACRTYNVLLSEGRRVALAAYPV